MCLVTQCKQNLTYLVSMIMKLYYFTTILVTKSILCSCWWRAHAEQTSGRHWCPTCSLKAQAFSAAHVSLQIMIHKWKWYKWGLDQNISCICISISHSSSQQIALFFLLFFYTQLYESKYNWGTDLMLMVRSHNWHLHLFLSVPWWYALTATELARCCMCDTKLGLCFASHTVVFP